MRYLKKRAIPKSWPLARKKGNMVYITKPQASLEKSLTVLTILRDLLKLASIRAEIRKIVKDSQIEVNGKKISDERYAIQLFDVISIPKEKKNYRLTLTKNGKLTVEEISTEESKKKVCKIVGKKVLKKNKIQLNLEDGRNFLTKDGEVNDSAVIDLKQNKIEKILKVKEKAKVMIINGKKTGHSGVIIKIEGAGKRRILYIKLPEGEVKSSIENIIILE